MSEKLYDGIATVIEVNTEELRDYQTKSLTPEEAASGFNLKIRVKPDADGYDAADIEVEVSSRECTGKLAGSKQADISVEQLAKHGLISKPSLDALCEVFEAPSKGKKVAVYQKETTKGEGDNARHYLNTYFSNGAAKLSSSEVQKRLAMLTGKATAPNASAGADPFAS